MLLVCLSPKFTLKKKVRKKNGLQKKVSNPKLEKWNNEEKCVKTGNSWNARFCDLASPVKCAALWFGHLPWNARPCDLASPVKCATLWFGATLWNVWQWGKSPASPVKRPILRSVDRPLNDQSCNLPISREMTPSCDLTIFRAMTQKNERWKAFDNEGRADHPPWNAQSCDLSIVQ